MLNILERQRIQDSNPVLYDAEVVIPFEVGTRYWQVDLDGRYAVEALAKYYTGHLRQDEIKGPTQELLVEIEADTTKAVFIDKDEEGIPCAVVYTGQAISN